MLSGLNPFARPQGLAFLKEKTRCAMRVRSYIPPLFVAPSRRLLDALAAFEAPPVDEAEKNNMPLEWNEKGGGDARGYALVGEEEDVGQEHRGEEARVRPSWQEDRVELTEEFLRAAAEGGPLVPAWGGEREEVSDVGREQR